jgi:hypothetical protein
MSFYNVLHVQYAKNIFEFSKSKGIFYGESSGKYS